MELKEARVFWQIFVVGINLQWCVGVKMCVCHICKTILQTGLSIVICGPRLLDYHEHPRARIHFQDVLTQKSSAKD